MRFIFVAAGLSLVASLSYAQTYQLKNDVIDDGGTRMACAGYILKGSVGQSTIGKISSAGYVAYIGFWHPLPSGPGVQEDFQTALHAPTVFSMSQNYPNPVRTATTIKYALPHESRVDLRVFNSAGQSVRTIISDTQKPGFYEATWDIGGASGESIPDGVYFYTISTGDFFMTRKMVIMR
jgi:hypothetical protein